MVKLYGKQVNNLELLDLFQADEGDIELIYGRIGEGKTTEAVRRMLETLKNGGVVYTNIKLDLSECIFDDRVSIRQTLANLIWFRKRYYSFRKENYHYFNPDDYEPQEMVEFLSKLTDCEIYYDEGHWLLDSYEGNKFSKEKKRLLLHTRHLNRSLNIISQRTQAVQVTARGQVNRFFKCEKKMQFPLLIFKRTEYQDMKDNDVDETSDPVSEKVYFAKKKVMSAYDTKYLRAGIPKSQEVYFDAYAYTLPGRIKLFFSFFSRLWRPLKRTP